MRVTWISRPVSDRKPRDQTSQQANAKGRDHGLCRVVAITLSALS